MRTICHCSSHKMFNTVTYLTYRLRRSDGFSRFWLTVSWICSFFGYFFRPALRWLNLGEKEAEGSDDVGESGTSGGDEGELAGDEYRVPPTDELYCDYDSTWETELSKDPPTPGRNPGSTNRKHYKFSRFKTAAKDMQNYRHDYPQLTHNHHWNPQSSDDRPNLMFYVGEAPCLPDGVFIKEIHDHWRGNYDKLESGHSYIQWLFPLQEPGMNYQASTLTKQEIKDFSQNNLAKQNLLSSYKLMLDFYGIELEDEATGAVRRAENWLDRFDNLDRRTHNNLRITRILKCLGTLGYRHYQAPLVRFFLKETLVHGELPNVKESVLSYFVFAVLDKTERRQLLRFAYTNYTPKEEFVWCPVKIQKAWSRMQDEGPGSECDHDRPEAIMQVLVIGGSS